MNEELNYAKELKLRIDNRDHCIVCLNELFNATSNTFYLRVIDQIHYLFNNNK